jgi:beta-glucosidase
MMENPSRKAGPVLRIWPTDRKNTLEEDNLRHVLITRVESPAVAAQWNNNAQAFVEGLGLGIPVNSSSDPRHRTVADAEYNAGAGGDISMWPGSIGLAASFDPELVLQFGQIASREYRALGIATALSPQVDLATDPRWYRFSGTFGPDPQLSADLGRAYVDGFQTSSKSMEISGGWGYESVNAMAKHWPGGGTGEGGRDAHYGFGKYAVYPGNNLETH